MRWRRAPWPLLALAAVGMSLALAQTGFGTQLNSVLTDRGARFLLDEVSSDVVIIGIDATSLSELSEWPWPRRFHAQLLNRLASAVPRQVFFDIDFSSKSRGADDEQLASALAQWTGSPVLLPAFHQYSSAADGDLVLTEPLTQFREHAALASVNLRPDNDGLVRRVQQNWELGNKSLSSVSSLLAGSPRQYDGTTLIDYAIDPRSFDYVSYSDVLANRVSARHFADKTVLVGATAVELGDIIAVPLHKALPGIVVHALAYETARRGGLDTLPFIPTSLAALVWTFLLCFLFCHQSWRRNLVVVAAALALLAAAWFFLYTSFALVISLAPFVLGVITSYLISTLKSLEAETVRAVMYSIGFRDRDALLKSIVLSSTDCIVCIDEKGIIQTANPAASALLLGASGRLTGSDIVNFIPDLLSLSQSDGGDSFATLPNAVVECMARTAAGDDFPAELSMSSVKLKHASHVTVIVRDISERKAQQRQLQFQATHDPLTKLPNRAALAAHLEALLARPQAANFCALLMIDLDRFKEVNDTLGHSVGDYVLHEVARRFADLVTGHGFIARIGGDEFALVVDQSSDTDAVEKISRALIECLNQPVITSGIGIDIGMSIGIARCPEDGTDPETLFKNADVAMYSAKRNGSGFEYYDSGNDRHTVRRLTIVSELRRAISQDDLELHYQPKINLRTGRVDSAEALLRWHDDKLGTVRPDEFIALAEPTDLILPLSEWTFERAFSQQARWLAEGLELRVAVNVSARLLQDVGLPARIKALMARTGISPQHVELEITESAMMTDPERALRVIQELGALDVMISIDDYGTGFSSLGYLRDLPVHALKMDKSFVMNMRQHHDDQVIVKSTAMMAHAMNLKVVAEGVETEEDMALLRSFQYDHVQGYLFSPALAAPEFADWARKFNTATTPRQPVSVVGTTVG